MASKASLALRKNAALTRVRDTLAHIEESGPKLLSSVAKIEANLKAKPKAGATVLDRLAVIEKLTAKAPE